MKEKVIQLLYFRKYHFIRKKTLLNCFIRIILNILQIIIKYHR